MRGMDLVAAITSRLSNATKIKDRYWKKKILPEEHGNTGPEPKVFPCQFEGAQGRE